MCFIWIEYWAGHRPEVYRGWSALIQLAALLRAVQNCRVWNYYLLLAVCTKWEEGSHSAVELAGLKSCCINTRRWNSSTTSRSTACPWPGGRFNTSFSACGRQFDDGAGAIGSLLIGKNVRIQIQKRNPNPGLSLMIECQQISSSDKYHPIRRRPLRLVQELILVAVEGQLNVRL